MTREACPPTAVTHPTGQGGHDRHRADRPDGPLGRRLAGDAAWRRDRGRVTLPVEPGKKSKRDGSIAHVGVPAGAKVRLVLLSSAWQWRACMAWRSSLTMIADGLVGVPAGLLAFDAHTFQGGFGLFLVDHPVSLLLRPLAFHLTRANGSGSGRFGPAGVIVGGPTAVPGALPSIGYDLQGPSTECTRGLTQPFIVNRRAIAVATLVSVGSLDAQVLWLSAEAVPAVRRGTASGVSLFGGLNEANFGKSRLALLPVSGCAMSMDVFVSINRLSTVVVEAYDP